MYEKTSDILQCDVLVVGGGGAGIRAALEAAKSGKSIILATQTKLGNSGSTFYKNSPEWGIMFAHDENDVEDFYNEILNAADGCVNKNLVYLLAKHSKECFQELEQYGLHFTSLSDLGVVTCFGKKTRGALLDDLGEAIDILTAQIKKHDNILLLEDVSICELIVKDGVMNGALGFASDGSFMVFSSPVVILACGGAENLYEYTYASGKLNGSSYAMAARHGARIVNLEFIQFINATVSPVKGLNYYQYVFATLPEIVNQKGEAFLENYLPEGCTVNECLTLRGSHGPFTTADNSRYFDLSIVEEWEKGNDLGVIVRPDARLLRQHRYAHWCKFLQSNGFALDEKMAIFPHCHAFNGGVMINDNLMSDIPGLFACGESAGGCHGPNRMGGNSMLATQVFGKLTAQKAVEFSNSKAEPITGEKAYKVLEAGCDTGISSKLSPEEVMCEIKCIMQKNAFLKRTAAGLSEGINKLNEISSLYNPFSSINNKNRADAFDAFNALCCARLILTAMLERKETRGGHYRTDYPNKNKDLSKMQFVKFKDGLIEKGIVY